MVLPCPITELIPQKGKMGFNQTLIEAKLNGGESRTVITEDNIFLDNRRQLSNAALIEYINQLTAAVLGFQALQGGNQVQKGLFVGLQDAEFLEPVYRGDVLTLCGFLTEEVSQVSFIQGVIERDGQRIAQLITKLYHTEDLAELSSSKNQGQVFPASIETRIDSQQSPLYLASKMHQKLYSYIRETSAGDGNVSLSIVCPQTFEAFDGHFPGNPILPGVILLEIATVGLELLLSKTVCLKSIKKMKISGMVLPGQMVICEIKVTPSGDNQYSFMTIIKDKDGKEISRFNGSYISNIGSK